MARKQRIKRRRGKSFYLALAIIILGEAIFIASLFLAGIVPKITNATPTATLNSTVILKYMLSTLINPFNNSIYNATALGLINNEKPFLIYMTINDPYLTNQYCTVWPALYNASVYRGYNVVVVVFPEPPTLAPSSAYVIQQFEGYVKQLCDFNIASTNFIITTAFWNNYTPPNEPGVVVLGYGYLLPLFLNYTGINPGNATFPILIGVGPGDHTTSRYILYGVSLLNETQVRELINSLGPELGTS
ncbi:hypothetical protein [Vulcanisaeta thermophila]|uniref:hypothetical protein n=1 Tax=Vulcanisaeta thermophila TaxID=867917 RepID=UPI0008531C4B|nr:hypothetical protein [Vulcanisaeta thermophila]